jgi:predicted dehydrogenase
MRVGVVGAGAFGRNHLRVLRDMPTAELTAVYDADAGRAQQAAAEFGCRSASSMEELAERVDGAVVAAATPAHAELGCWLLERGKDVMMEKPLADTLAGGEALVAAAQRAGRILQVGHLERFNPAVEALEQRMTLPLFFEIHRLSLYSPRSLDVDVVLDLMVHDLEILLAVTGEEPEEVRAAGIGVLSRHADIASVRLQWRNGCVANLTASRVSTEQVRKMRVFQPGQYLSVDYAKQELYVVHAEQPGGMLPVRFEPVTVVKDEPLKKELADFVRCMAERSSPRVGGEAGLRALRLALLINQRIAEHGVTVQQTIQERS